MSNEKQTEKKKNSKFENIKKFLKNSKSSIKEILEISENKKILKKGILVGSIIGTATFFSYNADKENRYRNELIESGLDLAMERENYSDDFIQEGKEECPKAIATILKNNFTILTSRIDGYTVIDEMGLFKWVSLEGKIYSDMKEFLNQEDVTVVSYEDIKDQLCNIPEKINYDEYFVLSKKVKIEKGKQELYQAIYKDGIRVGEAQYIKLGDNLMNVYVDGSREIYAGSLAEFTILNNHKELVRYSKESAKNDLDEYPTEIQQETITEEKFLNQPRYTFAEYYQQQFPLEEANNHVYINTSLQQQEIIASQNLLIIDNVARNGLLCINKENEMLYCSIEGKLYKDYVYFLSDNGNRPVESMFEMKEDINESRYNVLVDGISYVTLYDENIRSFVSSKEELEVRKQMEYYKKTNVLPDVSNYINIGSMKR